MDLCCLDVFGMEQSVAQIIIDTDAKIATSLNDMPINNATIAIISCYDNTAFNGFGHPADGRVDLFQRTGFTLLEAISAKTTADAPWLSFRSSCCPCLSQLR